MCATKSGSNACDHILVPGGICKAEKTGLTARAGASRGGHRSFLNHSRRWRCQQESKSNRSRRPPTPGRVDALAWNTTMGMKTLAPTSKARQIHAVCAAWQVTFQHAIRLRLDRYNHGQLLY